jgi:hypothetical protein
MNSSGKIETDGTGIEDHAIEKSQLPVPARRRFARIHLMLIVACVAEAIVISAIALSPLVIEKTSQPDLTDEPSTPVYHAIPQAPYLIFGYTRDAGGALLPACNVVIKNLRTNESGNATSGNAGDSSGFYMFDLSTLVGGYLSNDVINATASKNTLIGWNQTICPPGPPYRSLNITL